MDDLLQNATDLETRIEQLLRKTDKHDSDCECDPCHLLAVKEGDIDCGQCSVCAEEATAKAELRYDAWKENGLA